MKLWFLQNFQNSSAWGGCGCGSVLDEEVTGLIPGGFSPASGRLQVVFRSSGPSVYSSRANAFRLSSDVTALDQISGPASWRDVTHSYFLYWRPVTVCDSFSFAHLNLMVLGGALNSLDLVRTSWWWLHFLLVDQTSETFQLHPFSFYLSRSSKPPN